MILKVFCLYDSKVESYLQPFFMKARGEAFRAMTDLVSDMSTNVAKHPSDFTLFELGSFDDASAKFEQHATPVSLGVAVEFVKS
jgi:hypothetical protein